MKTKKVAPADRVAVMRIVYVRNGLRNTMLMSIENLERIEELTVDGKLVRTVVDRKVRGLPK